MKRMSFFSIMLYVRVAQAHPWPIDCPGGDHCICDDPDSDLAD